MAINNLARYLATQITQDKLEYDKVIKMYPQYKKEIDEYLRQYFDTMSVIPTIE